VEINPSSSIFRYTLPDGALIVFCFTFMPSLWRKLWKLAPSKKWMESSVECCRSLFMEIEPWNGMWAVEVWSRSFGMVGDDYLGGRRSW